MVPADGFPKERQGCPQIHSADFLECEARIGSQCPQELRMATSGRLWRSHPGPANGWNRRVSLIDAAAIDLPDMPLFGHWA
jgi:hypothetical protein